VLLGEHKHGKRGELGDAGAREGEPQPAGP
jgi:hypothetical protein